jgi:molybdate transport system substrate-binding protein
MRLSFRPGQINGMWLAFIGSAIALALLIVTLAWDSASWFGSKREAVFVYCAASLKQPVEAAARAYEEETGTPIVLQFGGSQTLMAQAELGERGDLYIPADDGYVHIARDRGLIDEVLPLARMTPVLVVAKGNPLKIGSLDDVIQREDVRMSQADAKQAAVGKVTREALSKSGNWAGLLKRTVVTKPTVSDVATDVRVGAADAGIIWDAMLPLYPQLERVPAPELEARPSNVAVTVLKTAKQPTEALRFARYLAARDRGLIHFKEAGFEVVDGDLWKTD